MKLSDKQQQFTVMIGKLIQFAHQRGYGLTFGEAYRTPEQAKLNAQRIRHCQQPALPAAGRGF